MAKGFSIIVAFDEARGIGKDGILPWHLPADLRHFKEITTARPGMPENAVIMGRKTWESIPEKFRPLPGRLNAVITGNEQFVLGEGVERHASFQAALDRFFPKTTKFPAFQGDVFVIGGARVFTEAIRHPFCEKLYLTLIEGRFDADVYFPYIPPVFIETERSRKFEENEKIFSFLVMERKSNTA